RRLNMLKDAIGEDKASIISHYFGGAPLYIPRCDKAFKEWRNWQFLVEIDRMKASGISTVEAIETCCSDFGLTDRKAWDVLKRLRSERNGRQQGSLF
ncbi:Mor transcription activator family protein, partial [Serratia fonticola]